MNTKQIQLLGKVINEELNWFLKEQTTAPTSTSGPATPEAKPAEEPTVPAGTPPGALADPAAIASTPPTDPAAAGSSPATTPAPGAAATPPPPEEPPDPITSLMTTATDLSKKTKDTPQILKAIKAGIQDKFSDSSKAEPLVKQLTQSDDPTLVNVGQRLNQFIKMKEATMKETVLEQQLRAVIAKLVDKRVRTLKESGKLQKVIEAMQAQPPMSDSTSFDAPQSSSGDTNFDAVRSLALKAQQTALGFEADMRKELDLLDPNKMDRNSQELYAKAMDMFHSSMVAAVTDAVNAVKALPKNTPDKQQ